LEEDGKDTSERGKPAMQQHEYVLKNKPLQGETETRSDLWTLKGKEGKHLKRLT